MANQEQLEILKSGVENWNKWREENPGVRFDFEGADLSGTDLSGADLEDAINLDKCKYFGNSYIDYHTLSRSKNLSLSFLRGCGLSDDYINAIPSLFEQPLRFYYCFISYSAKDQEFAERLFSDLQNRGIRAWYAPHELKAGKNGNCKGLYEK